MHWYDWSGLFGIASILFAYFLLQAGRMRGDALMHQLLNAAGALLLLIAVFYAFNLSAFLMELAWLAVSIYGMVRGHRTKRSR
ncbi:MAG: hypothetical protein WBV39_13030 [Rudaea sp.]